MYSNNSNSDYFLESDDKSLIGDISYYMHGMCYCVFLYYRTDNLFYTNSKYPGFKCIEYKAFGNGVDATNWMIESLECPLFTLLKY